MTAATLALELEVSERTIYRNVDALSAAGVPIYGEPGQNGGYSLLDSFRTNLNGLNDSDVRALFMLRVPDAPAQLGMGQELKAALLKLTAALPAARREDEEKVRQRFYLDSTPWHEGKTAVPHLQTLYQAIWQSRKLMLTYRLPYHGIELQHLVEPYGLVAKASTWYLVHYRDGFHVQQMANLLLAQFVDESYQRQPDFDLEKFWQEWCVKQEANRSLYPVTVRVAPHFVVELPYYFGDHVNDQIVSLGENEWTTVILYFESLEAARTRLLGLGRAVEVLEPRALQASIQDYGTQIVALYQA